MAARFSQIKAALLADIEQRVLQAGDKVPSENQLASRFNVSRMTARRALSDLVNDGTLYRSQGLGTFVADHRPMSSMLTIRSITDEIRQRGHQHSNRILQLQEVACSGYQATLLGLENGQTAFHLRQVHFENHNPVQLEDRLVNPAIVPEFLHQDFTAVSTYDYLNRIAPLTEADHSIEAVLPGPQLALELDIEESQPCLQISRRTWSRRGIVSVALLTHPGNRYRLGGHLQFNPTINEES